MKKWLKRFGLLIAILLVLGVVFVTWLLEAESGARFALERVKDALANKLGVEQFHGALASPLELTGVRYRDPVSGLDITIRSLKIEYSLSGLFSKTLQVQSLDMDGVSVALTTVPQTTPAAPPPSIQSLLTPPLDVLLERAHVTKISVSQDGASAFAADSIDAAAKWTHDALTVSQLAVRAPDGKLDLTGALNSYSDFRGNAKVSFDWRAGSHRAAGSLDANADGKSATLALALRQPLAASLGASLSTKDQAMPWTATLNVPAFDARELTGNEKLHLVAVDAKGSGDRTRAAFNATLDINSHKVLLDPVKVAFANNVITLDALRLRSPDVTGSLDATGKVQLAATPASAELAIEWNDVELPADLAGQQLGTHGRIGFVGSASKYDVSGNLAIGPPGKLADIAIELDGTPQEIALQQLELRQAKGNLKASGTITLQPQTGWNLAAAAKSFDPGAFAAGWPGSIDLDLSTSGRLEKDGPAGELKIARLAGTLRQRPLGGSADLHFAPPLVVDGTLDLKSGASSVTLRGKSGSHSDIHVDLAVASLGDWLPDAAGTLRGGADVVGTWPKLDARGSFDFGKIALNGVRADAIKVNADVHDLSAPDGQLMISAKSISSSGYTFDTLQLDARGNQGAHTVALDAHGPQIDIGLKAAGDLNGSDWSGSLASLALTPKGESTWQLARPVAVSYKNGDVVLGELCLGQQTSSLCASATHTAAGASSAKFSITHLALASIAHFAAPDAPLKLDGEIGGEGDVTSAVDGTLSGHATISSAKGSIAYPDSAMQPLVAYRDFAVSATLAQQQSTIGVRGEIGDGGKVDGQIVLGASGSSGMPINGHVALTLNDLGLVDLLSEQTSATKGKLDAKLELSGTTSAPGISGDLSLADFATEIPSAGLKLHDGCVSVHSADGKTFAVDGVIGSGDGKLALSGNGGFDKNVPVALKISGENFLAADIPGAQARISPDLSLTQKDGAFNLTGSVTVPKADVDVSKLPSAGAAKASPDVVVTDAAQTSNGAEMALNADVTVTFGAGEKLAMDLRQGQEVHLVGFGLNGYLSGQFAVQERPGRPTSGRGQIVVDGTYKAYGQDLKIEQGRLLFAGTPVENPGLDIRATRGFTDPDVTVGLQVRGTAQVPVLTVFSDPAMEQSDALSYLVAGKPLSQLKSGEGDAVGSAARALGTAGGDLLAKSVGSRVGLDDVGIADSTAVGGAALTVGKYLSPRLYLSYGVGLFTPGEVVTLRYRLTRLFNVEVQNGTLSSRAGINYKIEK